MEIKSKIELNKKTHSLRVSQIIGGFGIGAMVDFSDQTLMVASSQLWDIYTIIHDERLQKSLKVKELRMPPTSETGSSISMVRFPKWYFCPKCRTFKPITEWDKDYNYANKDKEMKFPKCLDCNRKVIPAGIITICNRGHINDFPWIEWTHYNNQSGFKDICDAPNIKIKTGSSNLGLEGIKLKCENCGATTTMKGAFGGFNSCNDNYKNPFELLKLKFKDDEIKSKKIEEAFICKGNTPWNGKKEKCTEYPITVQRGALNVYFPKVESSIIIPPYSQFENRIIEENKKFKDFMSLYNQSIKKNKLDKFIDNFFDDYVEDISEDTNIKIETVRKILKRKINNKEEITTKNKYREEEYEALKGNISKIAKNTNDFKIEEQNIDDYNCDKLSKVVLVKKLREVRALIGFSRINPPDNNIFGECEDIEKNKKSKFVSLKGKDDFYPAYQSRGEGIFIELNEEKITKWINSNINISKRVSVINNRYNEYIKNTYGGERCVTEKFVLLHTLAHLLIRELSFECGYATASLVERIYCNEKEDEKSMAGILIYTASGDSEGTLGGLVRQGKSDTFPNIIKKALERAKWCSNDPVCIESTGQGRNSLNLAACHACTLLPETSCEEFNLLLDRKLLVGGLDDEIEGFFSEYINF